MVSLMIIMYNHNMYRVQATERSTSSLKNAEWSRCFPPRTIGSSYSNCRSNISGKPFTRTANAVSVQGLGDVASGEDDSEDDITI
jgi:hypothetical protein